MALKRALCENHEEQPFYGYRKVVCALQDRGIHVGRKLVRKLKKEMSLKQCTLSPRTACQIKPIKNTLI